MLMVLKVQIKNVDKLWLDKSQLKIKQQETGET